ncbi:hypothetical protein RFI_11814 [Reticulomyxa filosa]|uniref:F-box domain-containing protein n=1 Tax=Reticulomyxa filosa TaxID=46433 RepID=X6NH67_RETFI|nr:hypothetical protein RFI_11814 [Reticulomyxa filosa]|eukprot:ETO25321.1 hypothetical protein RFI_11814 [Reticulomyxa filosa]
MSFEYHELWFSISHKRIVLSLNGENSMLPTRPMCPSSMKDNCPKSSTIRILQVIPKDFQINKNINQRAMQLLVEKMNSLPIHFKETELFHMYKQILRRMDKLQNVKDLTRFFSVFSFEELKEILRKKLDVEIEKCQKNKNAECFSVQNKIRDIYLCTGSFDEILPTTMQAYIFSFLDHDSFEHLFTLSRSFWRTFTLNPVLFRKVKRKENERSKHYLF